MKTECYFNELSLNNRPFSYETLSAFKALATKVNELGFKKCRVSHKLINEAISSILNIPGCSFKTMRDYLYGFFISPYENELIDDELQNEFIARSLILNSVSVEGLAWAFVAKSLSISYYSEEQWNTDSIVLTEQYDNKKTCRVHHAGTVSNVDSQLEWIESLQNLVLVKTEIVPQEKKFSVRDDHGSHDVIMDFWKRIRNNKYVVSCINSLPYNKFERNLVRRIKADGKIELVLYWTDSGYGLVIQTTGKTYRETKAIAEILEKEYSV